MIISTNHPRQAGNSNPTFVELNSDSISSSRFLLAEI